MTASWRSCAGGLQGLETAPLPPDYQLVERGTGARVAIASSLLLIGFATDQVTRQLPGIGISLVALAGVVLVAIVTRPKRPALALIGLALLFTALMAVRANPYVEAMDTAAAVCLAVLGASYAQAGTFIPGTVRDWLRRGFALLGAVPSGLGWFVPVRMKERSVSRLGRAIRAAALVAVALVVFGALLSSADAVFARVVTSPLRFDISWANIPRHAAGTLLAAIAAGVLLAYAARPRSSPHENTIAAGFSLSRGEWVAILGSVCAMFALFVVIQSAYLFGGDSRVLTVPDLTYAQYARSGFGQMIAATALTMILVGAAWVSWTRESHAERTAFAALAAALLGLNLVVMASAFRRLALYEGAFGWTEARLLAHAVILWLGAMLLYGLAAILVRNARWMATAGAGFALAVALIANVVNTDAFIADRNLARYRETGKIDAYYLAGLSGDATPTLIGALPRLPAQVGAVLEPQLSCRAGELRSGPWYSWNLSRAKAREAALSAAISPQADPGGCGVSF